MDLSTNSVRKAVSSGVGTYSFVGLPIGTYRLTISKAGFNTVIRSNVSVEAGQTTDINVSLKVGTGTQQVTVSAAAVPLLQTTSSGISTVIKLKQLQDLPLSGRDVASMAFLTPGYAASPGISGGTWNGLPSIAQGNSIDGVVSTSTRMKFAGNASPGPSARLDAIQQMTVDTSQMNVSQGYGLSAMTTNFITQRGTNSYHGRVYEDFRNSYLNANSWFNDAVGAPKNHFILNDFGGDFGGPILKNKLFFFGAFAMAKQPGGYTTSASVLTPLAQKGIFTQSDGTTVNLFTQVAAPNGLPTTLNSNVSSQLGKIDGILNAGNLSPTSDPNVETISWFVPSPQTTYFPTVRVDYDISSKVRMDVAWNMTKFSQPGASAPFFPGSAFSNTEASRKSKDYTASLGLDWTISPTLVNQFRGGYYYNATWYAYDATNAYVTQPIVGWALGTSGQDFHLPITTYYPVVNFSDGMTWQKGPHMVTYGVSYWREQDHYWNPPDGILTYNLGLVSGDPAYNAFESYFASSPSFDRTDSEALYATLVGRISHVGPNGSGFPLDLNTGKYATSVGAFNLDELQSTWNLYVHDSWRLRPTLTVNYGLRWGFYTANHDLTGAYHSADLANVFGPTAPGQLFEPGRLNGIQNPVLSAKEYAYQNYYATPQPQVGFAWNPRHVSGFLAKLTGDGQTVVRAGFNLTRFTEPQQYYWNAASNYGFAFYQYFSLNPSGSGGTGTFAPGSLSLGDKLPPFYYNIQQYQKVFPQSGQTWFGSGVNGFNFHIHQPYMMQWNLGIQREIGQNNVLSITYLGHHSLHEWVAQNPNEVNIFENGFLSQFQAAQHNLAINAANGMPGTFAYNGLPGQQPLPIFDAAFAGEATDTSGHPVDYSSGQFINDLNHGAAGSLAGTLSSIFGTAPYFCNMVGASFSPCANQINYTGAGAGYPINFFQANPYASGSSTGLMSDAGFGNYNALQIDFRQNNWHGMEFDANYTWSHALGVEPNNQWQGATSQFTMRNIRLNYGPSLFDVRQVLHVSGTYDLPFGNGQQFLNTSNPLLNRVVAGWTVGTIITYQTGTPYSLFGGYGTFNRNDGGLLYPGLTNNQLQSSTGVYHVDGPYANTINPMYLQGGGANPQYITPNTVPGSFGYHTWLYGPHFSNTDIAITKTTPIREDLKFIFQAEFLNAFNHPNWNVYHYYPHDNIQSSGFGTANVVNGARQIQLRASIVF